MQPVNPSRDRKLILPPGVELPDAVPDAVPDAAPDAAAEATATAELEALTAERDSLADRLKRLQAEFRNVQTRAKRTEEERLKYASEALLGDLLRVLDTFQHALDAAADSQDFEAMLEGLTLTKEAFWRALEQAGVCPIPAVGQPFDPAVHEAIAVQERDDVERQEVAHEHLPGFMLHERVLRPAQVIVARPPEPESMPAEHGCGAGGELDDGAAPTPQVPAQAPPPPPEAPAS